MLIPDSTLSVIKYLICGNNWDWLLNWNLTFEKLWTGSEKALLISMLKKLNLFRLAGLIILVLLMWKLMGPFLRKNHFLRLGLPFSSKLNWYSYIISMAKTTAKKIGDMTCSMRFLSLEVALYLYKPIIQPCMEYCCHVWIAAPSCCLEMLDKLQKWIGRITCCLSWTPGSTGFTFLFLRDVYSLYWDCIIFDPIHTEREKTILWIFHFKTS